MIRLALDQATKNSGYAIFEDDKLIKYGIIQTPEIDLADRMVWFRKKIINILEEYNVDEVIVEDVHLDVRKNPSTFKILAEWLGALLELLAELKYPTEVVLPSTWRSTLKINSGSQERKAQKRRALEYVVTHYNLNCTEDEADAICIGAHAIIKAKTELNWE